MRLALGVSLLAAVARCAVAVLEARAHPLGAVVKDSASYLAPARSLAEHARFDDAIGSTDPMFLRTPGYPVFLAGLRLLGMTSTTMIVAVQGLLSGLTVWCVFLLGRRLAGLDAALAAAVMCALEPLQWWAAGSVLTESIDALALVIACLLAERALRTYSWRWFAATGLGLAAATYVRPISYYLPPVLAALVVLIGIRRHLSAKAVAIAALAVIVPAVVAVGAWQVRNHIEVDSWRFSGAEEYNLYELHAAAVVARQHGISLAEARQQLEVELGPRASGEDQGPYYARMGQRAQRILRGDPVGLAVVTAKGFVSVSFGVRTTVMPFFGISESSPVLALALALLLAFYVLCAIGAATARGGGSRAAWLWILCVVCYMVLLASGPEGYSRMRAPVMPLLTIPAAVGLLAVVRRARRASSGVEG